MYIYNIYIYISKRKTFIGIPTEISKNYYYEPL